MSYKIAPLTEVMIPNYLDNFVKIRSVCLTALYLYDVLFTNGRQKVHCVEKQYGKRGTCAMEVKEVYFDQYCNICKHLDKNADEDPCWDCLNRGWNYDSHKPHFFEEDEQKAKVNQSIEGANKT